MYLYELCRELVKKKIAPDFLSHPVGLQLLQQCLWLAEDELKMKGKPAWNR
jgi:hypothetical protein